MNVKSIRAVPDEHYHHLFVVYFMDSRGITIKSLLDEKAVYGVAAKEIIPYFLQNGDQVSYGEQILSIRSIYWIGFMKVTCIAIADNKQVFLPLSDLVESNPEIL